jgi:TerC family integral membrane protein
MWSLWVAFIILILSLLALDLGVFHRKAHVIDLKEALMFSGAWIGAALVFNVFIYFAYEYHWFGLDIPESEPDGQTAAILFLTGYMVEKSLGIDNVFVIAMIFSYFGIPVLYQHRVLFWGIVGALVMRAVMILAGVALIQRFHWILYVFGAFLIVSGVRMAMARHAPDAARHDLLYARCDRPYSGRRHCSLDHSGTACTGVLPGEGPGSANLTHRKKPVEGAPR